MVDMAGGAEDEVFHGSITVQEVRADRRCPAGSGEAEEPRPPRPEVAEAHGNRTHQGDFSSPSPVLKTGPPTSDGRASIGIKDITLPDNPFD